MTYDLAIIGGGPAGVAAGVYAARKKLKTVFLTKDFGGQSSVSNGVQNWIGTVEISGLDLAENLKKHLKAYAGETVDIKEGALAEKISGKAGNFTITTPKGEFKAKAILIASGSRRRKLEAVNADKFEHKGITYCASCDGPLFADQDVVVVGGGNAAFESASQLLAYCPSVSMFIRGEKFRADPSTVEKVSADPKFKLFKDTVITEVKGDKFIKSVVYKNSKTGETKEMPTGGIFVEVGSIPNTDFVKSMIKMDEWNQIVIDPKNQKTSVAGIWAAGDCTDVLYHQNNIAAGDAVRALEDIYINLRTK